MESPPPRAPAVVAVLVANEPAGVAPEVLAGLAAQDYPNLRLLVLDGTGSEALVSLLAAHAPGAYRRVIEPGLPFGAAANEAINVVQGAAYLCLVQRDVLLEPTAIRSLVEEAYRSNAGLAGPKVVEALDPSRLVSAGLGADKAGFAAPVAELGERDQEQHDAVRDVFFLSTDCLLVRADLFATLGGFDPVMERDGDELDLAWRAHVAGARVLVVPSARAAVLGRRGVDDPVASTRRAARNRLRTTLSCYGLLHRARVLPQAALVTLAQVVMAVLRGRFRIAGALIGAWGWNIARYGQIQRRRRALRPVRAVADEEVRSLQVRGFVPLTAFWRGQLARSAGAGGVSLAGRHAIDALRSGARRASLFTWAAVVLAFVLGSRLLLTGGIPVVGELVRFPSSGLDLLAQYRGGLNPAGIGSRDALGAGEALLGLLAIVLAGATGLARTVAVLGPILAGYIGAWRLTRPFENQRARISGLVVYAALPLPYNALSRGSWSGIVAYGLAPWVLARLARASGLAPYGPREGVPGPGLPDRSRPAEIAGLGLLVALGTAIAPLFSVVVLVMAVGIVIGSLVGGGVSAAARSLVIAVGAVAVGLLLHLPWAASAFSPSAAWAPLASVQLPSGHAPSLAAVLRFQTGRFGADYLGYGILASGVLALAVGRHWRFAWAVRAWAMAFVSIALAWAGGQGWLPVPLPAVELVLAPAGAALAFAAALSMASFDKDVAGTRWSWRQPLAFVALAAVVVGSLPLVAAITDGRWRLPEQGVDRALPFLASARAEGSFRVLWLGDPRALPGRSWWLADGVGYELSDDGAPGVASLWPGTPSRPTKLVPQAVGLAAAGETTRLGRLLGPLGVRYLVVPLRTAPGGVKGESYPPPLTLLGTLAGQLDLARVITDESVVVYENTAWLSVASFLPTGGSAATASQQGGFTHLLESSTDDAQSLPAAVNRAGTSRTVSVPPAAGELYLAVADSSRWTVRSAGTAAARRPAFGVAAAYALSAQPGATTVTAHYATPSAWTMTWIVQLAAWLAALVVAVQGATPTTPRRRRTKRRAVAVTVPAPVAVRADDLPWTPPAGHTGQVPVIAAGGAALAPDDPVWRLVIEGDQVRPEVTTALVAATGVGDDSPTPALPWRSEVPPADLPPAEAADRGPESRVEVEVEPLSAPSAPTEDEP